MIEHSLSCKNSWTYDVVIDGASMVSNCKTQSTRCRDDSYAGLTEKMKQSHLLVKCLRGSHLPSRCR